ncbi:Uncharacterised protein [Mycobacteroides abscessus]|nr:Uncharacterised protein [Mycobacteroides abscessus]
MTPTIFAGALFLVALVFNIAFLSEPIGRLSEERSRGIRERVSAR